ncbi:hypothetical protein B0H67DRAFT_582296 [Lasiosphaeris hirsuta]|uniref:Uncharacterized protein n=1 Tax=Lasiosphaeris hirsuta TaxID=260670 RepID=A0AA40DUG8_9PEZI|nr:hypothetical protein B0H67DRAFT_582296 [Lasiosphaeris hirsuta]
MAGSRNTGIATGITMNDDSDSTQQQSEGQVQTEEKDRLNAYLARTGLAHRALEIRAIIAQGAQDVRAIMTQPWSPDEIRAVAHKMRNTPASVVQVTGIMWYLAYLALKRNQAFAKGAYLCRDPEGRLLAYFSGIGKARISSHLKRHSGPGSTTGMDLRVGRAARKAGTARPPPLPHGRCHVLSIAITNDKRRGNCLFLKPERYGVHGVRDLAHHAVNYARSVKRRHTFGGNDVAGMRKERIPDEFVVLFAKAVVSLDDGPNIIAEVGRKGEGEGIAGMHEFLTAKLGDQGVVLHAVAREQMRALLARLESEYDFVGLRFGNEVVVDLPAELEGPFPEATGIVGPSWELR